MDPRFFTKLPKQQKVHNRVIHNKLRRLKVIFAKDVFKTSYVPVLDFVLSGYFPIGLTARSIGPFRLLTNHYYIGYIVSLVLQQT